MTTALRQQLKNLQDMNERLRKRLDNRTTQVIELLDTIEELKAALGDLGFDVVIHANMKKDTK